MLSQDLKRYFVYAFVLFFPTVFVYLIVENKELLVINYSGGYIYLLEVAYRFMFFSFAFFMILDYLKKVDVGFAQKLNSELVLFLAFLSIGLCLIFYLILRDCGIKLEIATMLAGFANIALIKKFKLI